MPKPRFKLGDVLRWDQTELGRTNRERFGEPLIVEAVLGHRDYRLQDTNGRQVGTDGVAWGNSFCCDHCRKDEFLSAVKQQKFKVGDVIRCGPGWNETHYERHGHGPWRVIRLKIAANDMDAVDLTDGRVTEFGNDTGNDDLMLDTFLTAVHQAKLKAAQPKRSRRRSTG